MSNPQTNPCSKCGAAIPPEDLSQGLAINDNNILICKVCVDAGGDDAPTSAQVIRPPMMQQNIYRFSHDDHDELNRFTFLTAGHIALHRRITREQGEFEPPEYEHDSETKRLPAITSNKTTRRANRERDPEKLNAVKSEKNNKPIIIGALAAVFIVAVISAIFMSPGEQQAIQGPETLVDAPKQRSDFSDNPVNAWTQAKNELAADNPLLNEIEQEVRTINNKYLSQAEAALAKNDSVAALDKLNRCIIPDDALFDAEALRKSKLLKQRNQLIAGVDSDTNNQNAIPEQTDDPDTDLSPDLTPPVTHEPLEYLPIIQLTSAIGVNNNVGHASQTQLATVSNCENTFIGKSEAIRINDNGFIKIHEALQYPHSFTISFWFRTPETDTGSPRWLYSHGQQNSKDSINIYLSGNMLRTVIALGELNDLSVNPEEDASAPSLNDGKWHQYILSVANNEATVYIDGENRANKNEITGPLHPSGSAFIGSDYENSNALLGSIARFACFQGNPEPDSIKDSYEEKADIHFTKAPESVTYIHVPMTTAKLKDHSNLPDPYQLNSWDIQTLSVDTDTPFNIARIIDLDADGFADLLVKTQKGNAYAINKGDGSFNDLIFLNPDSKQSGPVDCGDLNNDGHIDIIESPDKRAIQIYINDGTGRFEVLTNKFSDKRPAPYRLEIVDFNNDQRPDFLISESNRKNYVVYFCIGNVGDDFKWRPIVVKKIDDASGVRFEDIDNDGDIDLIESSRSKGFVLHKCEGSTFSPPVFIDSSFDNLESSFCLHNDETSRTIISADSTGNCVTYDVSTSNYLKSTHPISAPYTFMRYFSEDLFANDKPVIFKVYQNGKNSTFSFGTSPYDSAQELKFTGIKHNIKRCTAVDLNGDGYKDIALYSYSYKEFKVTLLFRNPIVEIAKQTETGNDKSPISKTLKRDAPAPLVMSQFDTKKKHKSVNIYDSKAIEADNLPEQITGDITVNNYPEALLAKAAGQRKSEIELKLENINVKDGGILFTTFSDEEPRKQLSVIITDRSGKETAPFIVDVQNKKWQTHSIDMSSVDEDFDSENIVGMHIIDTESVSSINFFLHRVYFYNNFIPTIDDLPTVPRLILNEDIDLQDTAKPLSIRPKKWDDTIIVMHKSLYTKSDFIKDMSDELEPILNDTLSSNNYTEVLIDERWISLVLDKKYLKKKPSYVVFVGVGCDLLQNTGSTESVQFWTNVAKACLKRKALPIFVLGPGNNNEDKAVFMWSDIIQQFKDNKLLNMTQFIDMREQYMKDSGFKHGERKRMLNDLARNFHEILSRNQDLPDD